MKICVLYFTLTWPLLLHLVIAPSTSVEDSTHVSATGMIDPLYLLYYEAYNQITFVDGQFIENKQFSSINKPSRIVLLCPTDENQDIFGIIDSANVKTIRKMDKHKCKHNFEPSIKKTHAYEIGYRIHAIYNDLPDEDDFIDDLDKSEEKNDNYWGWLYELDYNPDLIRTEVVRHFVFGNMHFNDYTSQCHHYNFGQDILGNADIAQFYKQDRQEKLLKIWNIPIPSPYGYLVMHQFAPIQDNTNDVIRSGLCTYLNTVPLWQHVSENSVRKVEEFVRRVADVIGYIEVMTGAPVSESTDLYLDPDSSMIPIPRIIVKTLFYGVQGSGFERLTHIMHVFIHNEPTSQIKRKICQISVCEHYGWNFDIGDVHIGHTYCCLQYNPNYPTDLQEHYSLVRNVKPFDLHQQLMKIEVHNDDEDDDYSDMVYRNVNVVEILKMPESEHENAILQSPEVHRSHLW